jgi:MFS family permease
MRELRELWRAEPRARWFFAAHLQGGLGTAAGYVGLLLFAYDRIGSAWAATAVMLADIVPAMVLGPLLGGLVDRTSRLGCAVAADLLRAAAFAGLIFAGGIAQMIALALVAGVAGALSRPATSALVPSLVSPGRLNAANALYAVVRDWGELIGPAVAAGLMLLAGPELVIGLNAATFAISAALLLRLRGGLRPATGAGDARVSTATGVGAILRRPLVRTLMASSGVVVLVAGTMNVAELVLAQQELGSGGTGFALLISAYGCGLIVGSLRGARDDGDDGLWRRYLAGLALMALGLFGSALAPALPIAMLTFALTGVGNSLFLVSDRILLQRIVPERLHGRAFGLLDSIEAWGFCGAVVAGAVIASSFGGRVTFAIAGTGMLVLLLCACRVLGAFRGAPTLGLAPAAR